MSEFSYGFELTYPIWLLLLPLPFAVYYLIPAYSTKQQAIKVPFFGVLVDLLGEKPTQGSSTLRRTWWQRIALILSWLLLILAATKPVVMGEPQVREQIGRDVMVVVDLSGSMSQEDFSDAEGNPITRLDGAKQVLEEFAKTREGDRLGLILFGDAAFVQTPFTADQKVWLSLLNQTEVAMAGPSTHLGDAIGLATKVFSREEALSPDVYSEGKREKVAIVLTDGNDTESLVPPIDAAKVAKAKGVRIHMVAMGDPETVGEQAIDMNVIEKIAETSEGQAFQALDQTSLNQAYQAINQLEPQKYESTTYQPKESIHHYLIMLVLLINMGAFITASLIRSSVHATQSKEQNDV